MSSVTVVGAGVIGMSVAHELAVAGHRVRVVAARDAAASVSAVAAAIWFPHDVERTEAVLDAARVTYQRLAELARDPATGVAMRGGTVLVRHDDADLSWTGAVPHHERVAGGLRCTLPLVQTDVYLRWLRAAALARGVRFRTGEVGSIAQLLAGDDPDVLVVAAGLGSGALLDDPRCYPIRGQVVRLANPGLTAWLLDSDNPDGLTYIVPRSGDVVCGGTGDVGSWDERVDPRTEKEILTRVAALVPALAGQPVLSRAVGLRPARDGLRVEAVAGHDRPVFACYGHGGAGFTLSWGDAARITALVGRL